MAHFRPQRPTNSLGRLERPPFKVQQIRDLIAEAMAPAHFFQGAGVPLQWEHLSEEDIPWEILHGHLLDRSQTQLRRTFEAWNVYSSQGATKAAEPVLAVKLDVESDRIHITRAI